MPAKLVMIDLFARWLAWRTTLAEGSLAAVWCGP